MSITHTYTHACIHKHAHIHTRREFSNIIAEALHKWIVATALHRVMGGQVGLFRIMFECSTGPHPTPPHPIPPHLTVGWARGSGFGDRASGIVDRG